MASRTWTGAVSTSWATAGNWSPATVPVSGDDVFIPETATNDLTTNTDRTGDNAGAGMDLGVIRIQKDSTVAVGTSAAPLKVTCDELIHLGLETLYYDSAMGTGPDVTTATYIQSNNLASAAVLGGVDNYTRIFHSRGGVSYRGTASVGTLFLAFRQFMGDAKFTVSGASSPLSTVFLVGGNLDTTSNVANLYAFRGRAAIRGTATLGGLIQLGADITYDSSGTMTLAFFCDGSFDSTGTSVAKTFGTVWKFPPHEFLYADSLTTFSTSFIEYGDRT